MTNKYKNALDRLIKDDYEYFDDDLGIITRCEDTRRDDIELLLRFLITEKAGSEK